MSIMIQIGDKFFDLEIERKRNRNIYIRVEANTIKVTCPYYVSKAEVMTFVDEKRKWIYNVSTKKTFSKTYIGDTIYFLGKEYKLVILHGNKAIKIDEDTIYIKCRDESIEKASKVFYEYGKRVLKQEVEAIGEKYLTILRDYGYYKQPVYNFKYLTSMWGCCYSEKNTVNLSVRLVHFDNKSLEAILWHELLHFIIPNHSKRFHEVLELHMPEYNQIIKDIK